MSRRAGASDAAAVAGRPPAAVIVPFYQAADGLGACLASLVAQEGLTAPLELIAVDDGSTDEGPRLAGGFAPAVRLLRQPHRGAAAARNLGAAAATADILLFTDADCRPAPDWAARMLEPLQDPAVAGVKGFFRSSQTALLARVVQAEYEEKDARLLRQRSLAFADTAAAGYRRAVFQQVGGFREDLGVGEDTELAFRVAGAAHRLAAAPRAWVAHRHPERLRDYVRRKFRYGLWGGQAYLSHPRRLADDSRSPLSLRLQLLLAPVMLIAAALWPWQPAAGLVAALAALAFAASCLPYLLLSWPKYGAAVALAGPPVFLLRAVALDAGLLLGLLGGWGRRPAPSGPGGGGRAG